MQIKVNGGDGCFDGIVRLFGDGFLPKDLILSADEYMIKTPTNVFVKSFDESSADGDNDLRMGEQGASWFAEMRGEPVQNDSAEWQTLIEKSREYFHKKYSWLEYNSTATKVTKAEEERDKALLTNVLRFWHWSDEANIIPSSGPGEMHVFGAGLRLEINNGVGEPKAIIGHIYFSGNSDGSLSPIPARTAALINESMQTFDSEDAMDVSKDTNRLETIGTLMRALEGLFERREGSSSDADGLEDWLFVPSETDREALMALAEQGHGREGAVPLVCSGASLLNVFHMRKPTRVYSVELRGRAVLLAEFVLDESVSIRCKVCSDARPIIENNQIKLSETEVLSLDITKEDFGLSVRQLEKINKSGVFSEHLIEMACENGCAKTRCRSALFSINEREYCKDCPHRDVIYPIGESFYPTRSLAFDNASVSLILPKNERGDNTAGTCRLCNRSYRGMRNNAVCKFCSAEGADQIAAKRLYKKYAAALPLHTRLFNLFNEKACYEDEEFIMFVFGTEEKVRYYLSKYKTTDARSLSDGPQKIK